MFSFFYFQAISDLNKKVKSLSAQLKEISGLYEDEQRQRDEQHNLATKAEKRANEMSIELEDARTQTEQVCKTYICTHKISI